MPPLLSDEDMSDASGVGAVKRQSASKRAKRLSSYADAASADDNNGNGTGNDSNASDGAAAKKGRAKSALRTNGTSATAGKKKVQIAPEVDDDIEDDNEEAEEEYEVQQIVGHMLDDNGDPRFHVMWKGYENPSDHTWEPEGNLAENASEILNDYIFRIGGRESLFVKPAKGKKRSRQSGSASGTPTSTSAAKRSRKSESVTEESVKSTTTVKEKDKVKEKAKEKKVHPADREALVETSKPFKLPAGSWEDDIVDVEMYRGEDGELRVYLIWKNGNKSQHTAHQAYVRCPQRILKFYESHISFKS